MKRRADEILLLVIAGVVMLLAEAVLLPTVSIAIEAIVAQSLAPADSKVRNEARGSGDNGLTLDLSFAELHRDQDVIWGFDFLSESEIIYTLRSGQLKIIDIASKKVQVLTTVPTVFAEGQGGLLDVKVRPVPASERHYTVFLSYAKPHKDGPTTAVYAAQLADRQLQPGRDIFVATAHSDQSIHFGGRMLLDHKQDALLVTVGDRNQRDRAQSSTHHNGKVIKLQMNAAHSAWQAEVVSMGHRNPQGIAMDYASGKLFAAEFGPRGGDEVNAIAAGKNYGWPVITYGREYWGPKIGEGTHKSGMEQPLIHFVPSISPSGMMFYQGELYPYLKNFLVLACLGGQQLRFLQWQGGALLDRGAHLDSMAERFRHIAMSPQGRIWVATDSGRLGELIVKKPKS